ncbi:ABC transporter ATP-binding protein [Campylobacter hepaticus]|uniref:ABC transporter ATP-binding protein n=1 Tax=Campylobacter hepaticus TaxID=1813019 RepID=A0A424Z0R2_9BACT|nr:ABC transporter ATP-binding protein [Campylobacter hepaticus]RQD68458.1 ABC transporter ATP-binding protein [Campylobacter hepaticus]RQD87778.1 ABC transporter ATP-binding protein [Campylobacter hepaticus]
MLIIKNLSKNFGKIQALKNINLHIKEGEFLSILGGSGSGKSTLLRIIAQLEQASSYELFSCKSEAAMMFQNYALFPHLNVEKNILFALYDKKNKKEILDHLLKTFEIEELRYKKINEISGGQAQRVAFARAIARGHKLLLLDEPFSNLDQNLKQDLRTELKKLIQNQGITAIMVTHDIEDAYCMSDQIAFLDKGEILAHGKPQDLYFNPTHKSANILPNLNIINQELDLEDDFFKWIASKNYTFGYAEFKLGNRFEAKILQKEFLGAFYRIKASYKNIEFFILLSSNYHLEEKINFDIINF